MQPLARSRVPSTKLLKFLRAQSEGVGFFSTNTFRTRHGSCDNVLPKARRTVASCAAPPAPLEASSFCIDSLWRQTAQLSSRGSLSKQSLTPAVAINGFFASNQDRRQLSTSRRSPEKDSGSMWSWTRKRYKDRAHSNSLPPMSSFLDDNSSLGHVRAPENQLKLRCTEFDENGNVLLLDGEFKKSELIAKYGLLPRDLRKIDSSLLPNILVRPSAILINLLHLRVLIKHNRVLVFDTYGSSDSYTQSLFMYDLESKLRSPEQRTPGSSQAGGQLPYEFRALESVLISVTTGLEGEFEGVRDPVVRVLRELEEDIDRDKLRHLLIYSKKLSSFEQRARLVREAIDDILEADDDLASMYLTEKAQGIEREEDNHTEIEMLLESYHKVCDEIVQVSGNLLSNIRNTEEIIRAILDSNRNSLMLLELKFNIGTLGLSGGTFVAALYGMNLKNFIEESDFGFWGVSGWCAVISVIVCMWGFRRLRAVQRLSMWGGEKIDGGRMSGGGGSGRSIDPMMMAVRRERLNSLRDGGAAAAAAAVAAADGGAAGDAAKDAVAPFKPSPPVKSKQRCG